MEIKRFARSKRFEADAKNLDPVTVQALRDALTLLMANPRAKSLRLHPLSGYGKPTLWKIDVFTNKAWQVTFELIDGVASLKRVATHKAIDRDPRGE